jgi:membrane-associated phospholipid phosphatase
LSTQFLTIPAKPQRRHAPQSRIHLASRGVRIRVWVIAALLLLALASFLFLDATLVRAVHESGIDRWLRRNHHLAEIIRWPGHLVFALVVAAALLLLHPRHWRALALTLLAALLSGSNWFFKWVAGRYRPTGGAAVTDFNPFPEGLRGLFHERNLSMPSGDVSLAFALAATLAHLLPRHAILFFIWPALVAAERVAENAHHLSDVLAGAALGLVSFHLAHLACTLVATRREEPTTLP